LNKDKTVIEDFGKEWSSFSYSKIDLLKLKENFDQYFSIFPWDLINNDSSGFDMGCGTGRWAQFVAPQVKKLYCVEPSRAIDVAKKNLKKFDNIDFLEETTETCSIKNNSQDFGYSLGVLHHIPNTKRAIFDCYLKLKKGAPFLLYLYYDFENKPIWFKLIWKVSDIFRKIISSLPFQIKKIICTFIAYIVYLPLSKISLLIEAFGADVSNIPLSEYRNKPFYQSKNDALDRFGTRLEQRFSKKEITEMLTDSGFKDIKFSSNAPYWCVVAIKN